MFFIFDHVFFLKNIAELKNTKPTKVVTVQICYIYSEKFILYEFTKYKILFCYIYSFYFLCINLFS